MSNSPEEEKKSPEEEKKSSEEKNGEEGNGETNENVEPAVLPVERSGGICVEDFAMTREEFIEKSRNTAYFLKNNFKVDKHLDDLSEIVLSLLSETDDPIIRGKRTIFIYTSLPLFIDLLLKKSYEKSKEIECAERTNIFIQDCIKLYVKEVGKIRGDEVDLARRVDDEIVEEKKEKEEKIEGSEWSKKAEKKWKYYKKKREKERKNAKITLEKSFKLVIDTLSTILDADVLYYKNPDAYCSSRIFYESRKAIGSNEKQRSKESWKDDNETFVFSLPVKHLSFFYVCNVNCFGNCGGINLIMNTLLESNFSIHLSYMRLLEKVIFGIKKPLCIALIGLVVDNLEKKVSELTDDDINNVETILLTGIIRQLSILLSSPVIPKRVFNRKKTVEMLVLELNLKLFHSSRVGKKISGLKGIIKIIDDLAEQEKRVRFLSISKVWITPGFMCGWILRNKIIENIFQNQEQVIRTGTPVIRFVANLDKFSKDLIREVWNMTLIKHEALQTLIFREVFSMNLLPYLHETRKIDFFYDNLCKETPVSMLKMNFLSFVKQLSAIGNMVTSKSYGFDLLKLMTQDELFISDEIQDYALTQLLALVKNKKFVLSNRKSLYSFCTKNLVKKCSVPQTLEILKGLFEGGRLRFKSGDLEQLITIIFEYIQFIYKAETIEELRKINLENKEVNPGMKINEFLKKSKKKSCYYYYLKRYTREELLKNALNFVSSMFGTFENLKIKFEFTKILWKIIEPGFESDEKKSFTKVVSVNEEKCILDWLMESKAQNLSISLFFEKIIMNLETSQMKMKYFLLFLNFFIKINVLYSKIQTVKRIQKTIVMNPDLKGIEKLWEIALISEDEKVSKLSISYLNNFRHDISLRIKSIQGKMKEVREEHIAHCMLLIDSNRKHETRVINCLKILLDFVLLFLESLENLEKDGKKIGKPMEVLCKNFSVSSEERNEKNVEEELVEEKEFVIECNSGIKFPEFLEFISVKMKYPKELIRLYFNGVEITPFWMKSHDLYLILHKKTIVAWKLNFKDVCYKLISFNLRALGLQEISNLFDATTDENVLSFSNTFKEKEKVQPELIESKNEEVESEGETEGESEGESEGEETSGEGGKSEVKDGPVVSGDTPIEKKTEDVDIQPTKVEEKANSEIAVQEEKKKKFLQPDSPIQLLSKHFMTLFSLLDLSDEVAKYVFCLLSYLVIDPEVLRKISALESLEEFLPLKSNKYRLLYSLQIVSKEFLRDESWREKFLELKGLEHVISIIVDSKTEEFTGNTLFLECFSKLLGVLNFFFRNSMELRKYYHKKNYELVTKLIDKTFDIISTFSQTTHGSSADVLSDFKKRVYLNKVRKESIEPEKRVFFFKKKKKKKVEEVEEISVEEKKLKFAVGEVLSFLYHWFEIDSEKFFPLVIDNDFFRNFVRNYLMRGKSRIVCLEMIERLEKFSLNEKVQQNLIDIFFNEIESSILGNQYQDCVLRFKESFEFIAQVIRRSVVVKNLRKRLLILVELVTKRKLTEIEDYQVDGILVGLIKVMGALISKSDLETKGVFANSQLVLAFFEFLFPTKSKYKPLQGGDLPPKCKSKESRDAMCGFFVDLVKDNPNSKIIVDLFSKFFADFVCGDQQQSPKKSSKKMVKYRIDPRVFKKESDVSYLGIRNFGAICYMISLLQQLFMTLPFRNDVLLLNFKKDSDEKFNDNEIFLSELQRLFGYLSDSTKSFYSPARFCRSYKDYDGRPVNVGVQQDVDEFLIRLMDQVDEGLKSTQFPKLLNRCFKGQEVRQIIYEKKVISERFEHFYKVIVEVKNKPNLIQSLRLLIEGEHLTGDNQYNYEKLGKKVDAVRNCLLKELPPILIFQLKRFEYKFEMQRNVKYDGRLEFPMNMNMKEFCVVDESQNEEYYQYKLVGVLVHRGSADSGHYYSYICDRSETGAEVWYEFNDSSVEKYDVKNLENDCFGGVTEVVGKDGTKKKFVKRNSAYMLFYQRVCTLKMAVFPNFDIEKDISVEIPVSVSEKDESGEGEKVDDTSKSETVEEEENESVKNDSNGCKREGAIDDVPEKIELNLSENGSPTSLPADKIVYESKTLLNEVTDEMFTKFLSNFYQHHVDNFSSLPFVSPRMPEHIHNEIWADNYQFFCDLNVYSKDFDSFFFKLMKSSPVEHGLKVVLKFIIDVLSTSVNAKEIEKWVKFLTEIFETKFGYCQLFLVELAKNDKWMFSLILKSPLKSIKETFTSLIVQSFQKLTLFVSDLKKKKDSKKKIKRVRKIKKLFLENLMNLLNTAIYYRNFSYDLLNLILKVAGCGIFEKKFFVMKGCVGKVVDIITIPDNTKNRQHVNISSLFQRTVIYKSIELISYLSRCCRVFPESDSFSPHGEKDCLQEVIRLPSNDEKKLFCEFFFKNLVKCGINKYSLNLLIYHWCWDNHELSHRLAQYIILCFKTDSGKEVGKSVTGFTSGYHKIELDHDDYCIEILQKLLLLKDSKEAERVQMVGDAIVKHMVETVHNYSPTLKKLKWIAKLGGKSSKLRQFLAISKKNLEFVCECHGWKLKFPSGKKKKKKKKKVVKKEGEDSISKEPKLEEKSSIQERDEKESEIQESEGEKNLEGREEKSKIIDSTSSKVTDKCEEEKKSSEEEEGEIWYKKNVTVDEPETKEINKDNKIESKSKEIESKESKEIDSKETSSKSEVEEKEEEGEIWYQKKD